MGVLSERERVKMLPKTVVSGTQILTRSQKHLGIVRTAAGAVRNGHLHILEYLVERKYDKFHVFACWWATRTAT